MTNKQMIVSLTVITLVFVFFLLFNISQIKPLDSGNAVKVGNSILNLEAVISSSSKLPLKNPIDLAVSSRAGDWTEATIDNVVINK